MNNQRCNLNEIAGFLQIELSANRYNATERGGVFRSSNRPVTRLGLALDPWPDLGAWVVENELDALWFHRPWKVNLAELPADVGILFHHLPFDETLTMGYNPILATTMGALGTPETLGFKQQTDDTGRSLPKRPIGMLFDVAEQEFDAVLDDSNRQFGGYDRAEAGRSLTREHLINRVAVVGAMNEDLIREAHERGAGLYLTGQYRKPAQEAVNETGMAVIAVGHQRSEEWGLNALAGLLHEQWPALSISTPLTNQPVYAMSGAHSL